MSRKEPLGVIKIIDMRGIAWCGKKADALIAFLKYLENMPLHNFDHLCFNFRGKHSHDFNWGTSGRTVSKKRKKAKK